MSQVSTTGVITPIKTVPAGGMRGNKTENQGPLPVKAAQIGSGGKVKAERSSKTVRKSNLGSYLVPKCPYEEACALQADRWR